VLQCVAVCCSVLQCVAVCTGFASVLLNTFHVLRELNSSKETHTTSKRDLHSLQRVASCSVLQRVAVCCSVLQCIALLHLDSSEQGVSETVVCILVLNSLSFP